jgi:parallel beta-helix repeat protein
MRKVLLFCLLAATAFALLAGTATARTAKGVVCGSTLTKSVKLTKNLNCKGNTATAGLTVGADGITINLNKYAIIGPGSSYGLAGISNPNGYSVTIKNGAIKNFYYGYYSQGAHGETVSKLRVLPGGSKSYYGIYVSNGGNNTYSLNNVSNAAYGIVNQSSDAPNTFTNNTLNGNGYGGYDSNASAVQNTWTKNDFSHNTGSGFYGYIGGAILTSNKATYNGGDGFYLNCAGYAPVDVEGNTASHNGGDGFESYSCSEAPATAGTRSVLASGSTFKSNKADHNVSSGFVAIDDENATFTLNTATVNSAYGFYFAQAVGDTITSNASTSNLADGFYFDTGAGTYYPSLVDSNSSSSNHAWGFDADTPVTGSNDTGSANTSGLFNNVTG